jgi:molybdopterin molybdotransferase
MLPTRSVAEILALIDARFAALPAEEVAAAAALGRVLAADVVAAHDFPPFDRAMIDGLAVRSAETVGASAYSPLPFQRALRSDALAPNAAMSVSAGQQLPPEADCIVPAELTQPGTAGVVEVIETVAPEREVERRGSHFTRGTTLLRAGRRLRPPEVALLATAGIERVSVTRRPRVALVLAAGETPQDADTNASVLQPLVERDGGVVAGVSRIERTADAIRQAVSAAAAEVVLVVGGPSQGRDRDIGAALGGGGKVEVAEIALQPGGSLAMGRASGGAWLFSLPNAPAGCFWSYEVVVGRAIRRLAGRAPAMPFRRFAMRLTRKVVSAIGMTEICPVRRQGGDVEPLTGSSPYDLLALGRADGFVIVGEGSEGMAAGAVVPVYLFDDDGAAMVPDPA